MMFNSFSASFPSRNTHPIRNLVTLLSMSHRFGYFCNLLLRFTLCVKYIPLAIPNVYSSSAVICF